MVIHCCLPLSAILQDHVPVTFKFFVGFLSCMNSSCYICDDFNIHVDVPVGDGRKCMTFFDSRDLKQQVSQPTHLHGHILDLILSQ